MEMLSQGKTLTAAAPGHGRTIGSTVLLNDFANVLNRSRTPISFAKGQWRQLQKFVAAVINSTTALLYPEGFFSPISVFIDE